MAGEHTRRRTNRGGSGGGGHAAASKVPADAAAAKAGRQDAQEPSTWLPAGVSPKFVRGIGTFGLLIGMWSVMIGMRPETEAKAWAVVFLLWLAILTYARPKRLLATAFGGGVLLGFYTGLVRVLLFGWYQRTNSEWYGHYFEAMKGRDLYAQLLIMVQCVVCGVLFGVCNGCVAWVVRAIAAR